MVGKSDSHDDRHCVFISKYKRAGWFVGGLLCGVAVFVVALHFSGRTIVDSESVASHQSRLLKLERANRQLADRLFALGSPSLTVPEALEQPYDERSDARVAVLAARQEAVAARKFLMVTFGANWCLDCRTLYRNLKSAEIARYAEEHFLFANVDVGKFNRNRDLAAELGVDLSRGIPVAIFFGPDGRVIGTTNEGQLEPARRYSSKQILRFMRDIAERSRIAAPDSVGG